ncbi:kinase-like domain-containing protein [Phyllosticta citriasiana]|uniref:kinase-like domain-containing protein n=1 Tax=Phyllosticta citriasiana TaxID=595635 RepID=UPI0030FD39DA
MGLHHAHQIGSLEFRDAEYDYDSRDSLFFTSIPVNANEDFHLGRASTKGKCNLSESPGVSATISKRHVKIHTVLYDDSIAPLVYAQDISSNGTFLQRINRKDCPHDDAHGVLMGQKIKSTLLEHGDELWPAPRIVLRYHVSDHIMKRFGDQRDKPSPIHAADMKTIEDRYHVTNRTLGSGGHGSVYVAIHRSTQQQQACKVIDLTDLELEGGKTPVAPPSTSQSRANGAKAKTKSACLEGLFRECRVLKNLDHPNIVRLEKVFFSINGIYIFQELITGGDLFSFITKRGDFGIPTVEAAVILRQVLKGLEYLHDRNIVHRDIKPDNILLTSTKGRYRVILTDFGSARKICTEPATDQNGTHARQRLFSLVGTAEFAAPEVSLPHKMSPGKGYWGKAIDMWSIGCIASALISGDVFYVDRTHPEFQQYPNRVILDMARNVNLAVLDEHPDWKHVGSRAKDFIKKVLVIDENARMTVKDALAHPWFTNKAHAEDHETLYQHAIKDWKPRQKIFKIMEYIGSPRPKMELRRSQFFSKSRITSPPTSKGASFTEASRKGGLSTIQEETTPTHAATKVLEPSYDAASVTQDDPPRSSNQASSASIPAAQVNLETDAILAGGPIQLGTRASPSVARFNASVSQDSTHVEQHTRPPLSPSNARFQVFLEDSTPYLPPPFYMLNSVTSEPSKPNSAPPTTLYESPLNLQQSRQPISIMTPPRYFAPPHDDNGFTFAFLHGRQTDSSSSSNDEAAASPSGKRQRSFDFDHDDKENGAIIDVNDDLDEAQPHQEQLVESVKVVHDSLRDPAAKRMRLRYR